MVKRYPKRALRSRPLTDFSLSWGAITARVASGQPRIAAANGEAVAVLAPATWVREVQRFGESPGLEVIETSGRELQRGFSKLIQRTNRSTAEGTDLVHIARTGKRETVALVPLQWFSRINSTPIEDLRKLPTETAHH